jgi:hypothetical protein
MLERYAGFFGTILLAGGAALLMLLYGIAIIVFRMAYGIELPFSHH